MRHDNVEANIYPRVPDQTPRDILIDLLESEGDVLGWEEDLLIYEAALRLDESHETALRMVRYALQGLLRDRVVLRKRELICLRD